MIRSLRFILIVVFVVVAVFGYIYSTTHHQDKEHQVHYHAGFKVFVDGQLQDFSKIEYMHSSPCVIDNSKKVPEDPQVEKAHLHDKAGDVVHVHREGGVWGDLFKNIKYSFPPNATISAYMSGQLVEDILNYPIKSYDSIIIIVGDLGKSDISHYVTVDRIKEIEQKSESCAGS